MENLTYLSKEELQLINGGGFWDVVGVIAKTVIKYSGLGGALVVGIGDGLLEAVNEK